MYVFNANITSIKTLRNVQKLENMNSMPLFMLKNLNKICMLLFNLKKPLAKPIFINHHVMCSLMSCCCNHLNNMLMNVKLMVIQLKLNGIGYMVIFHNYSKFASNIWYTLICKFEKCKPNSQKLTWVWTYIVYWILEKRKIGIFFENKK